MAHFLGLLCSQLVKYCNNNCDEELVHDYLCVLPLYNLLSRCSPEPYCKMKMELVFKEAHLDATNLRLMKKAIAHNIKG